MIGEVYNQSICIINEVAHLFYIKKMTQTEISKQLNVSLPTVSRLLKRAVKSGIIEFNIIEPYAECYRLEKYFMDKFNLKTVLVLPVEGLDN